MDQCRAQRSKKGRDRRPEQRDPAPPAGDEPQRNRCVVVKPAEGRHQAGGGAVAACPEIIERNIGHAIIADAVFIGLAAAVARMRRAMELGRGA